jgi:Protein of unknown function (DUF3309)
LWEEGCDPFGRSTKDARFGICFDPGRASVLGAAPAGAFRERAMSLGTILVIILVIVLLAGFSGRIGGYRRGRSGIGLIGVILIVLLILLLLEKI